MTHPLLSLTIPGKPVSKGRPRIVTGHGHPRAITPNETLIHENWIREHALTEMGKTDGAGFPINAPVVLMVTFYLDRPKKPRSEYPDGRPDLDNLIKAVEDGLQLAHVFTDDARVVSIHAHKKWGSPARTELVIVEAEPLPKSVTPQLQEAPLFQ